MSGYSDDKNSSGGVRIVPRRCSRYNTASQRP